MLIFETLLALLAICVALALFARKLNVPTAVALVLGGMAMALIPGVPHIALDPELALALFLPPLLQVSAQRTDWQAFRSSLVPIMLLAIVAVVLTAFAVGVAARFLIPSLSWWPALALGAIVAPPDAVAATSVLRAFRIPRRIITVLEGESLINDTSSLVLYRFAVAATVAGTVSFGHGTVSFFLSALGGAAIGAVLAFLVVWILKRLEDPTLEIMVSMLAGFGSFLLGERLHVSGVLAAVACGAVLGRHQLQLTAKTRVEGQTTWQFVEFVLTSLLFVLIGIQLRQVVSHLHQYSVSNLILVAVVISATLILSRIIIVFGTFYPVAGLRSALRTGQFSPPLSYPAVISWAGMRGVVSLATALALPEQFPARDLIVFLAFCSILATLVLQGTTLGPLIRRLSVAEEGIEAVTPETVLARKEAATAALDAITGELANSTNRELADKLVDEFKDRVKSVELLSKDAESASSQMSEELNMRLKAIAAARTKLGERRDELDGETFATLIQELDLEEEQLNVVLSGPSQPV